MILLAVGLFKPGFSQDEVEFVFANNENALDVSSIQTEAKDHPMGDEVAIKLELIKSRYTYIEPASPTSPSNRTIVVKHVIYNSIMKLNRYFKKEIKKGNITKTAAKSVFLQCLNSALVLYAEDTEEFENYLKKRRGPDQIVEAYQKVILK